MTAELFHSWDGLESVDDTAAAAASQLASGSDDCGGAVECDCADGPPFLSQTYQQLQTTLPTIIVDRVDGNQVVATETSVAVGYQLVGRDWGESHAAFVGGEMALITLDPSSCHLTAGDLPAVAISLEKHGCHILRWKSSALLVAFRNEQHYSAFGRAARQSGVLPGTKLRVQRLQGATYADFPPCFLISQQSSAPKAASVRADLDRAVRPFQSRFRFISVTDNLPIAEPRVLPTRNPSIGVVLLFSGRQQAVALSCLQGLGLPSWQAVDLPHDTVTQLGAETPRVFRHTLAQFPSVGLATGYPLDGVRVVVYVRDEPRGDGADRFCEMVKFYERLLGRSSSTRTKLSSTVEYQTFSQTSRMSEFVVARYVGLNAQPSASLRLCFLLKNAIPELLSDGIGLAVGFSQLADPDGNLVLCACPLQ